jgi:hypothetical protein
MSTDAQHFPKRRSTRGTGADESVVSSPTSAATRRKPRKPRASVIPLRRSDDGPKAVSPERECNEHARFLQSRYGERWRELPATIGRSLVQAEALLGSGPVVIQPSLPAMKAIVRARRTARAAAAMGRIATTEADVLGEALGANLIDLPLQRLAAVVDAVLALSTAPLAEPGWGSPVAAMAADALLDACSDDLNEGARTHHAVNAQFTDAVWDVPERRLRRGRRPYRPVSYIRLRRSLTTCSRTHRAPSPVWAAADLILEGRAVSDRLSTIGSLLKTHLGEHDRGAFTDVAVARAALESVRDLHDALGDRLNPERLSRLLAADAFKNDAVLEPARILDKALKTWSADLERLGGAHAVAMDGSELIEWATLVEHAVPVLEDAVSATDLTDGTAPTLRDVVYDLRVRERYNDLTSSAPLHKIDNGTETAS